MESRFYEETLGIYRLRIPFDTVYTSVFLIKAESGIILVDCATTQADVDDCIIPALKGLGYAPSALTAIVLTHRHGDHAGGLERILHYAPDIKIITKVCQITESISTYPLPGHTRDSIGVFDNRSGTLISGDGMQGAGVDKYRCSLQDKNAYLETLQRISKDVKIENILFSHAYEPWNSDTAYGRREVDNRIKDCLMCASLL